MPVQDEKKTMPGQGQQMAKFVIYEAMTVITNISLAQVIELAEASFAFRSFYEKPGKAEPLHL